MKIILCSIVVVFFFAANLRGQKIIKMEKFNVEFEVDKNLKLKTNSDDEKVFKTDEKSLDKVAFQIVAFNNEKTIKNPKKVVKDDCTEIFQTDESMVMKDILKTKAFNNTNGMVCYSIVGKGFNINTTNMVYFCFICVINSDNTNGYFLSFRGNISDLENYATKIVNSFKTSK